MRDRWAGKLRLSVTTQGFRLKTKRLQPIYLSIPGRLAMETGDFSGDEAACPTPRLGLSFSVVRFPSPFRGVSFYSIEGV
jgi:hypothetical protein